MRHPFDPRDVREPTVTQETLVHPLSRLQAELAAPPRDVLELRTDQPPVASGSGEPVRLRLVALDTYDGSAWQVPSVLTRALGGLPRSSSAGTGTPVDERITLHQLDSPWLPSLGWPASVRMDGSGRVGFDAESGNLLSGTSGGANGASYQLTATVSHLGPEQLRSATASAFDARYVRLPNGASQLPGNLSTALAASGSGYDRLNALADRLRGGYAYDPSNAPSGHSLGQLRRFLSGDVPGSAEQFATVFALTARQLGYPSRVVIGYRADVGRLENGRVLAVSSKDLHAWPEIHFDGIGWVPFEPTPDTAHAVPPPPAAPQTSLSGAALGAAAPQQPLDQSRLDRNSQREKRPALVLWQRVGLGVLAVLAVIGLVASGPPAAKAARRARRRRGTPTAQVLGAWAEARDRLREHGLSFAVGSTASEVAKAAEGSIGPDAVHLGTLAPLVATAVYRPEGATPEGPALAWAAVGHLRRGLNRRAGSLGRIRAALDPRPLRRRGATPVKDSTPAKDNPQAKEKLS
jgi:hypothetical protein